MTERTKDNLMKTKQRGNPNWKTALAKAHACPRCGAKTRTGRPCRSAAMPNGRCRIHGGASPGAPRGQRNGRYKHDLYTAEQILFRKMMKELLKQSRELTENI
jgi:hypothetical protein